MGGGEERQSRKRGTKKREKEKLIKAGKQEDKQDRKTDGGWRKTDGDKKTNRTAKTDGEGERKTDGDRKTDR